MEQHAFEFLVGVEPERAVGAVEGERDVRKLLPAFSLLNCPLINTSRNKKTPFFFEEIKKLTYSMEGRQWVDQWNGCQWNKMRKKITCCISWPIDWFTSVVKSNLPKATQSKSATWRIIFGECRLSYSGCLKSSAIKMSEKNWQMFDCYSGKNIWKQDPISFLFRAHCRQRTAEVESGLLLHIPNTATPRVSVTIHKDW